MRPDSYVSGSRPWEDVVFIQDPVEVSPNHQMPARIPSKGGFEGCAESSTVCCLPAHGTWRLTSAQGASKMVARKHSKRPLLAYPSVLASCGHPPVLPHNVHARTVRVALLVFQLFSVKCVTSIQAGVLFKMVTMSLRKRSMKGETSDNRYSSSPDNTTDALRCNAHVSFC